MESRTFSKMLGRRYCDHGRSRWKNSIEKFNKLKKSTSGIFKAGAFNTLTVAVAPRLFDHRYSRICGLSFMTQFVWKEVTDDELIRPFFTHGTDRMVAFSRPELLRMIHTDYVRSHRKKLKRWAWPFIT